MMRVFRLLFKGGVFFVAIFIVAVGFRLATRGDVARADSSVYNPSYCLGAWGNPIGASGAPQAQTGDPLSNFPPEHVAFLAPDSVSLIFCGYFNVEARERPPKKARVSFVWAHDGVATNAASSPVEETPPSAEVQTVPNETEVESVSAPEESSTPSDEPGQSPEATGLSSTSEVGEQIEPETSAPETNVPEFAPSQSPAPEEGSAQEAPAPAPAAKGAEQPSAVPAPEPSSTPAAWGMFLQKIVDIVTPKAFAAETAHALLQVSYSFDGIRWFTAGHADAPNWNTFSVDIPANSWDDLHNLQIMILPLPGNRPAIYLDAIELSIECEYYAQRGSQ